VTVLNTSLAGIGSFLPSDGNLKLKFAVRCPRTGAAAQVTERPDAKPDVANATTDPKQVNPQKQSSPCWFRPELLHQLSDDPT
jgi:hypothetical protein